ncbi:hypothetical protein Btru_015184 [Bulinus truncatus]|nr:hypothetical protein Btru_015184 [Bulinus truncatus]
MYVCQSGAVVDSRMSVVQVSTYKMLRIRETLTGSSFSPHTPNDRTQFGREMITKKSPLFSNFLLMMVMTVVHVSNVITICPAPCKCSEAKLVDIGTVYKIFCTDQKLQSILDISALKSVALPIHLSLNENEIKSVAMSDFSPGLPIQSLDLSSNKDIRIADAAFDNISPTLTKLTLEAISLTLDSPLTMVSSLSGLRELSISHNNRKGYVSGAVENVSSILFTGPMARSLKILKMTHCGIRYLADDAFKHLTYLEELDLSNNWFHNIPNTISSLRHLKKLVLVWCYIKRIKDDPFLGLSRLQWIEMTRNPIETIEKYAFRGLETSLKRLYLEYCHLKSIPSEEIKSLKALEYLDLTMNHFDKAPANSFVGAYCLRTLLISGNNLKFEKDTFSGQRDCIIELIIKQMNLSVVPTLALSQLNNLQTLTLEKAGIKTLPPSTMSGIKAKTISLAENDLTTIEPGAFLGLPPEVELNLRKTKISDIDFLLGYDQDAIATVNLDKTELQCRCSMKSSLNATLNISIYGACIKNNKTTVPFDSHMLKSVLNEACEEEERRRNAGARVQTLASGHFILILYLITKLLYTYM